MKRKGKERKGKETKEKIGKKIEKRKIKERRRKGKGKGKGKERKNRKVLLIKGLGSQSRTFLSLVYHSLRLSIQLCQMTYTTRLKSIYSKPAQFGLHLLSTL